MSAEGFALKTVKYERLSKCNYVLYQLYLAASLIDALQRREPALGDLKDVNQCTALFHSAAFNGHFAHPVPTRTPVESACVRTNKPSDSFWPNAS
jgi:hypothetical protein